MIMMTSNTSITITAMIIPAIQPPPQAAPVSGGGAVLEGTVGGGTVGEAGG